MNTQHDLFTAIDARDKGISKVSEPERQWLDLAHDILRQYPEKEATGEDLRLWVEQRIGKPHHVNVAGAMIMGACRKGILAKTGEYRQMKRKESHARVNPVYRINRP